MRCLSCGFENPEGLKFCNECGTAFKRRCPQCGFANAPQAKFCGECGISLVPSSQLSAVSSHPLTPNSQPQAAERRQLTVLFCDLVGSTALSTQLDPEDLRAVVRQYQQTCAEIIQRHGGYIAQYLGDGLLVYFGYPHAHEDDAARSIRTGLEILAAMHDNGLQVRIGIHTGPVVISEIGSSERRESLALGETPNIAAHVQGQATPQTVVISAATQQLVHGLFACQELGARSLKGVAAPLSLYHVVSEAMVQSRFEVAVQRGLTPLVGREHEVGLLNERWERAKQAEGQVVLLSGEPGIGKSRLVQVMREHAENDAALRAEFRCSPYHQHSAFYPIINHLQRLLHFEPHDTSTEQLGKLEQRLTSYRFPQADTVPLLAALLSLPHPEKYPALTFSPQRQKQKTQEVLVAWLLEEAERRPLYCPWEDIHWADPSTLELLTVLIDQVPTARLYLLLTFRPEFTPPWSTRSHISHVTLSRLGRGQVTHMIEQVAGERALPAEMLQQIVAKTDGVPLFVEELTKMVLESGLVREEEGRYVSAHGGVPIPSLAIPSTLQDSLMARLDRLAPVRELAQIGAVLGREFSYELLQAVSVMDDTLLQQGLRQLVDAELIYQRGLPPQATYLFKHALIQDTAYQSLLKSKRQQLHQQIAQVLIDRFPETVARQPELLAHHYTEAGLKEQAIPYWQQAGQRASHRSANMEAISHFTKGLELLKTLPDTPEHAQQKLTLQLALGAPVMATKGYSTPEVEQVYNRARELCQQLGETSRLFPVLRGSLLFYTGRADHKTARELAEQCLRLAQSTQEPAPLMEAHYMQGNNLFYLGEFAAARQHLEQSIAIYDSSPQYSHDFLYAQDTKVVCLDRASWILCFLGYPEQALKLIHKAIALAQALSHPHSLAHALSSAATLYQYRREGHTAQEQAEATITLSTEQGFPLWLAWGTVLRGRVLSDQCQRQEGLVQIRHGISAFQAKGAEVSQPYLLALLAEAYEQAGQVEEGLVVLTEALEVTRKNDEHWYEAELYRLKGELTLQSKVQSSKFKVEEEAEACFLKAIEIAQKQQAKSLELRAATSLARLWQQQGKRAEAHQVLSEIYSWFTEGFDTKDLQEANALLDSLESGIEGQEFRTSHRAIEVLQELLKKITT
jgi:predicted ATPase/class 3 adenylate cyclase